MNHQKFADLEVTYSRNASRISEKLDKTDILVGWTRVLSIVKRVDKTDHKGEHPLKELLCKMKMLFLQNLYSLGDPELEDQVNDRFSFQRFCGLSLDNPQVDTDAHSTKKGRNGISDIRVIYRY